MQRYVFRFFSWGQYRSEAITIIGTHHDAARVAAWTVLAEQEGDRAIRDSWRLVSTEQRPAWLQQQEQEVQA